MRIDLETQLECVKREIAMRKRVYPRWIEQGRMTQKKADDEIAAMEAVLETVTEAAQKGRLL